MTQTQTKTPAKRTTGSALADQIRNLEVELELRKGVFRQTLPEHVPVARFIRNLLTAVVQNPDLLDCYRPSLFQAAMTAASLGLLLDPALGHGYILPFKESKSDRLLAQFIPGYRGYIHLARQSGEVQSISSYEVRENDRFDFELGLDPKLKHKPSKGDRGEITHFYCVVHYKGGGHHIEVMTLADVDAIRARSRASQKGPWVTDYMMMGRKTTIRRAAKYMPLSVQRAAALDAAYDTGQLAHIHNGEIVIEGEVAAAEDQPVRRAAKALDRFEEEHGAEPEPEEGKAAETKQEPKKEAQAQKKEPETPEPPSPRKKKGAEWPPRVEWLKQRLRGMTGTERAEFLSTEEDFGVIERDRRPDWDSIAALCDELTKRERDTAQ